jgi:Protein of unknown function (DUF2723)
MHQKLSSDSRRAAALGLAFFALYVATLCPTVFRGDAGEILSAIWSNGVIHPPGYPLFTLLGKLFLVLVPWGEPALRVGVLVALAGAVAVALLYRVSRALETPPLAALGTAALLGVSLTFWSQCNRVEVYSLHLLFALLAVWQCLHYRATGDEKALYTACLAVGLGLAHHLTIVLIVPGLLVLCGVRLWRAPGLMRRLLVGIALLALTGLPLYGLLWGKLGGGDVFWAHVTGRGYRFYFVAPTSLEALQRPLKTMSTVFAENGFGPLGVLAILGALALGRRSLGALLGLLLIAATITAYCFCYTIEDIASYYLVPLALGVSFVGVALGQAERRLESRQRPLVVRLVACFVLPLLSLVLNFPACNLRATTGIRLLAEQKLKACQPNSILLTQGDEDTYSVRYTHDLLHVRPDVTLMDEERLARESTESWAGRPLASTYFGTSAQNQAQLGESLALEWLRKSYVPAPYGVILRLGSKSEIRPLGEVLAECKAAWEVIDLPELPRAPTATEVDGDYTRRHYVTMLCNYGFLYEQAGQAGQAAEVYRVALEWAPELAQTTLKSLAPRSPVAAQLLTRLKA